MKLIQPKYFVILISLSILWINLYNGLWKRDNFKVIAWDVTNYYGYLPAVFVHKDIKLDFINSSNSAYYANNMMFWPDVAKNGGKTIRTTMGLSICYLPFFIVAHGYSHFILKISPTGFEDHYEFALIMSSVFFFFIAQIYIVKILRKLEYSDIVSVFCLLSFCIGSNVLDYCTLESPMSHNYLFALGMALVYHIINWHQNYQTKYLIYIGFLLGFMTLIRPTSILYSLFMILYNVNSAETVIEKVKLFRKYFFQLLLIPLIGFLCFLPQLLYWKLNTGNFLYYSYQDATFFWKYPMIIPGLFSYRKGWLLYSPVFFFSLIGIIRMVLKKENQGLNILLTFILILYVLFSWCSWYYPLLLIPTAYFLHYLLKFKYPYKFIYAMIFISFIAFGALKNYQYYKGIIHYACMNKKLYWQTFLATDSPPDFYNNLSCPDEEKTANGIEEYYFNPFR
jgi:Dolichyl-phosphate-mannose-protein mannosyltransferase